MAKLSELLNKKIADHAAQVLCDSAQASLIRNDATLSGEDSELRNTWEEICVQVRGEQTPYWDAYECAMRDAVLSTLLLFDKSVIENLWLHTDEGWDLRYDLKDDLESGAAGEAAYLLPDIPVDEDAIARHVVAKHLIPIADAYSNPRVEAFLYPDSDDLSDPPDDSEDEAVSDASANQPSEEVRELEYYEDDDSDGRYFTCINRHYIFRIQSDDARPKWECINPNDTLWDVIHQKIYRNFRASRLRRDQLPSGLPPPPDHIPPEAINPPPSPPPEPVRAEEFSVVAEYLQGCVGRGTAAIHVVLYEDTYESGQGDGEFHYPEVVFFDLESAEKYEGDESGWYRYHIRPGVIWLDLETIGCEVPRRIFDHFSDRDVLKLTEQAIAREENDQLPGQ